jgi:hypothetical protein
MLRVAHAAKRRSNSKIDKNSFRFDLFLGPAPLLTFSSIYNILMLASRQMMNALKKLFKSESRNPRKFIFIYLRAPAPANRQSSRRNEVCIRNQAARAFAVFIPLKSAMSFQKVCFPRLC